MKIVKFNQVLFVTFLTWFCFLQIAMATQTEAKITHADIAKIKLKEPEIKSILGQFKTVGSILHLIEITATKEDYQDITKQVLAAGLNENSPMPTYEVNESWVKFSGLKKKFDLSGWASGEIYDGSLKWHQDSSKTQSENITSFIRLFKGGSNKSVFSRMILQEAHAVTVETVGLQELLPLGLFANLGPRILFFLSLAKDTAGAALDAGAVVAAAEDVVGAVALDAGIAAAGNAIVLSLLVETLWKAGERYSTGAEIRCKEGQLDLFLPAKNNQIIPVPSSVMSLSNPTQGQVGFAELKVRQALCSSPKADREMFNKILQSLKPSTATPTNSMTPVNGRQ